MKIHQFINNGDSCVISDSRPPRRWYNYLWSERGYCVQISQTGDGGSYYINERADMCRLNHQDARYVYLRDDVSQSCWNIGEGPLVEEVENYSCEHSIGYSLLQSEKNGIWASWRIFVPQDGYHEVWTLRIKNKSEETRKLSVFPVISFELEGFKYPRYYEMYRSCETFFDNRLNGVFCCSGHPFAPHKRYNGYIASSEKVFAYDGNLAGFLGTHGTETGVGASLKGVFQRPEIVIRGQDCQNSSGALFILGGVLQNKIELVPGEEKIIQIVAGVSESLEEAVTVSERYHDFGETEKEFKKNCSDYFRKYQSLSVHTPEERINHVMNNWLKKQVDFCIVGKKGVRDNLQIAVALLMYRPEKAKAEILEVLRHQFRDGHAVLTWFPYDDTRYSDQPFWIVWAVIELIKETGDYTILNTQVEYQDGGSGTVLDHMKAAVERLLTDKGPNGLTKIFFADWNDALNITTDPEAESVMLTHQLCLALKDFGRLMEKTGDGAYADYLKEQYAVMRDTLNKKAWDGGWYVRALSKDEVIGSKDSRGSKIYVNAQVWAVLADVPEKERMEQVLATIDSMEHDFGFPINKPPYSEYSPNVGRMGGMLPGLFENGGVYCHASAFKMLMDCKMKRAENALETLKKIMPDSVANPSMQSGAEPYVFTNCYSVHPNYYGKSYQSWTTGTSAWVMRGLYEGIMGINRDYDGLRIDPCFPAVWERAEVTREFRGTKYRVRIENPGRLSGGKTRIALDGRGIEGNLLPLFEDNGIHEVVVTIC